MDADVRADRFEQPRHEIDLHVMLSNGSHQVQHLLVPVAREGDDHAIHIFTTDDLADVFRGSQHRQISEVAALGLGVGVDEPEEVDPVLRMLEEFATDQLPDLPRADDQRVLDVGRLPPCERPGRGSSRHDEHQSEEPERRELRLVRARKADEPRGGVEDPDADRD